MGSESAVQLRAQVALVAGSRAVRVAESSVAQRSPRWGFRTLARLNQCLDKRHHGFLPVLPHIQLHGGPGPKDVLSRIVRVVAAQLRQGAPLRCAVVRPLSGVPGGKEKINIEIARRPAFAFLCRQEAEERICAFVPCGHTVCEGCAMQMRGRRRPEAEPCSFAAS